jgi:succinylglutamate desuccinylase
MHAVLPSYTRVNCLHEKISIPPRRDPASFCRELAKASYSAASCTQSPGITISFYNSRDLAFAE